MLFEISTWPIGAVVSGIIKTNERDKRDRLEMDEY